MKNKNKKNYGYLNVFLYVGEINDKRKHNFMSIDAEKQLENLHSLMIN